MNSIAENLKKIQNEIRAAAQQFDRSADTVHLLAVSKQQPLTAIEQALAAGQYAFGESYVQEALPKITALAAHTLEWHFIGTLQANKTRTIAQHFAWVHSLDKLTNAERLNQYRPATLAPLQVCLQINIDNEPNKAGIKLTELLPLATAIAALPHLQLRGLMALPAPQQDFAQQRASFRQLRLALQQLQQQGFKVDTLSMGMSADFVAAIAEGATIVRIGSALFGKRQTP